MFSGLQFQFGNSKAAAHVAVRASVLDTVTIKYLKYSAYIEGTMYPSCSEL